MPTIRFPDGFVRGGIATSFLGALAGAALAQSAQEPTQLLLGDFEPLSPREGAAFGFIIGWLIVIVASASGVET